VLTNCEKVTTSVGGHSQYFLVTSILEFSPDVYKVILRKATPFLSHHRGNFIRQIPTIKLDFVTTHVENIGLKNIQKVLVELPYGIRPQTTEKRALNSLIDVCFLSQQRGPFSFSQETEIQSSGSSGGHGMFSEFKNGAYGLPYLRPCTCSHSRGWVVHMAVERRTRKWIKKLLRIKSASIILLRRVNCGLHLLGPMVPCWCRQPIPQDQPQGPTPNHYLHEPGHQIPGGLWPLESWHIPPTPSFPQLCTFSWWSRRHIPPSRKRQRTKRHAKLGT